ncbi:hypothetical protein E2C01_004662 [Portunus trituberculatus]|uniref:Uncharacterized protein n=1 Tax=Portunus trituberculatus TaxID=210409 RepID=A0A5B7CRY6_PORTR|nr:hypothetical protein [Portunus trituberculatus]
MNMETSQGTELVKKNFITLGSSTPHTIIPHHITLHHTASYHTTLHQIKLH